MPDTYHTAGIRRGPPPQLLREPGQPPALTQIAADTLQVARGSVRVELGDAAFPAAPLAGGSMGTSSWGPAVAKACRELRAGAGVEGEVRVDTTDDVAADQPLSRYAFGAQFAEVRVAPETGEVRVSRLLGVFAAGRIINAKTARSQLIGSMTMGLGMALLEESVLDPRFGDYLNNDLASYHVPVNADVEDLDAVWVDEHDRSSTRSAPRASARSASSAPRRRSPMPFTTRPGSGSGSATSRSGRTSSSARKPDAPHLRNRCRARPVFSSLLGTSSASNVPWAVAPAGPGCR
jgi:hypothetical protein